MAAEQAAVPSIDEILATPESQRTETARFSLRWDLVARLRQLEDELRAAIVHDESSNFPVDQQHAPAAAQKVLDAQDELAEREHEFTFASMGQLAWERLRADFPPSKQDRENGLDYDPDEFPVHAMAATCISPAGMTLDKMREFLARKDVVIDTFDTLWAACRRANMSGRRPGESLAASAVLRRSRPSSEPPEATESPEAS